MRLSECQELSGAGILSYLHEFCIFRLDLILQKKKLRVEHSKLSKDLGPLRSISMKTDLNT